MASIRSMVFEPFLARLDEIPIREKDAVLQQWNALVLAKGVPLPPLADQKSAFFGWVKDSLERVAALSDGVSVPAMLSLLLGPVFSAYVKSLRSQLAVGSSAAEGAAVASGPAQVDAAQRSLRLFLHLSEVRKALSGVEEFARALEGRSRRSDFAAALEERHRGVGEKGEKTVDDVLKFSTAGEMLTATERMCRTALHDGLLSSIRPSIDTAFASYGSDVESVAKSEYELPTFSLHPLDAVTLIGDRLLSLPERLEGLAQERGPEMASGLIDELCRDVMDLYVVRA